MDIGERGNQQWEDRGPGSMEPIQKSQPFKMLGIDSDNGVEFLNFHVYDWLKAKEIEQTRSLSQYKNDPDYVRAEE